MSEEAAGHLGKAERLLAQAAALEAAQAPEAVIHLSYYAMFHAATAFLLKSGERSVLTHGGLIGSFGRLMRERGEEARAQGRLLNRAENLRLASDYGVTHADLPQRAAELLDEARVFVSFCSGTTTD